MFGHPSNPTMDSSKQLIEDLKIMLIDAYKAEKGIKRYHTSSGSQFSLSVKGSYGELWKSRQDMEDQENFQI